MDSDRIRRFDEPRRVEVLHDGRWIEAWQDGWVKWPSGEWYASVSFTLTHDWGRGRYIRSVPTDCVRVVE